MKKLFILIVILINVTIANAQWQQTSLIGEEVGNLTMNGTNILASSNTNGILLSINNGGTWTPINNGLPPNGNISVIKKIGSTIFAGVVINPINFGLYISNDNGSTWINSSVGLPTAQDGFVNSIDFIGSKIFVGTYYGVYISINNGASWTVINNGPNIYDLAVCDSSLFADANGIIYKTTDYGNSWSIQNNGLPNNQNITSLTVSGSKIFASTSLDTSSLSAGEVYMSADNGASWTSVSNGLPVNYHVGPIEAVGSYLFLTHPTGVYLSTDYGNNWIFWNDGLAPAGVFIGAYSYLFDGSYFYVSTSDGVWKRPLSEIPQCYTSFQQVVSPSGNVDFVSTSTINDTLDYPINYTWSFGDGSSGTGANLTHFYNNANGIYSACVTMQTANGCTNTFCDLVVFNSIIQCQAGFSFYQDSITVPPISPYVFVDQSILSVVDSVTNWSWNFGDGATSTLQNPVHTFTFPGTYNVCLTINTIGGCSSTFCDSIIIPNNVPINCQANFYSVVDSLSSQIYNFIDQSLPDSTSNMVSWSWHFTSGTPVSSSSQNPVNILYNMPGIYPVCLTITTASGCVSTFCDSVLIVNNPCQITATVNTQNPTTIGGNDGYIETNVTGGTPPYLYSWSTGQTTANIYNLSSGVYTLNIIDANSCNLTYSTQLFEPYDTLGGPIVDTLTTGIIDSCLNFVPDSFYVSNVVIDSINNIATISWTFTNGGLTSSITAQYTYYYSGNNAVILTLNCGVKTLVTYMSFINITASVGISDNIEDKLEINLYPVPFNEKLNIVFNSKKSGIVSLNVIDVTGRNLIMKQFSVSSGDNNIELNTSDFHSGIYILNIESDGKVFHKQIVK